MKFNRIAAVSVAWALASLLNAGIVRSAQVATDKSRVESGVRRLEDQADGLTREFRAESGRAALRKYEEARLAWKKVPNADAELRVLLKAAALARDLGQVEKALTYSQE